MDSQAGVARENLSSESPSGPPMAERIAALEGQLSILSSRPADKAWYRQPALIVSLAAFIMSLTVTIFSSYRTLRQDVKDSRLQLQFVNSQLNNIPLQWIDLNVKLKGDNEAIQYSAGTLNAQTAMLGRQAYALLTELGANASSLESAIVANALLAANELALVEEILLDARPRIRNISEYVLINRMLGQITAANRNFESSNAYFYAAINIPGEYKNSYISNEAQNFDEAWTYLYWAGALVPFNCDQAKMRAVSAGQIIGKFPDAVKSQYTNMMTQIATRCP